MTASKGLGSDFDKVDAYENGPDDFAESPELTDADFERGTVEVNGVPRSARPARAERSQEASHHEARPGSVGRDA